MTFLLLILLNAILLVRPAEVFPSLLSLPLYLFAIVGCSIAAFPAVREQLAFDALARRPITLCILGVLLGVVLSHLSHFFLWGARHSGFEFAKVMLYYLLLVGIINNTRRLESFLVWLLGCIAALASIAVLQYHELITLPGVETLQQGMAIDPVTGERVRIARLVATGIYNDPNDLSIILNQGILLSLYFLTNRNWPLLRWAMPGPLVLFLYALGLTHSRGGFLALAGGLLILCRARFGTARTVCVAVVLLPALAALFAGRMTDMSVTEGTGKARIELWSEGMLLFRQSPLFGIGHGLYADYAGQVAHNSFVHCFVELGFIGGTAFLSAFALAIWGFYRISATGTRIVDPVLRRMHPFLFAIVAIQAVGMLSLSRAYVAPTYVPLALATIYFQLALVHPPLPRFEFRQQWVPRLAAVSVAYLATTQIIVRLFAY